MFHIEIHLSKRVSASTVNHGIKILRVVFEDARRDGFCSENPARDCQIVKKSPTTVKRRPFSLDEVKSLLSQANDEWKSMILLGIYTRQRLHDLASLDWDNVNLNEREISLITSKTGRTVIIPIVDTLLHNLGKMHFSKDSECRKVHPTLSALPSSSLSNRFNEIMARAGLVAEKSKEATGKGRSNKRSVSEISFHSFRHTATSLMKNAGVSSAIVQDIIGHDSAEVSLMYTHIDSQSKMIALQTLPNLLA